MKQYYVYILANKYNKIFYIGFTDDIERRINEHKNKMLDNSEVNNHLYPLKSANER